jgi:hypothetical protein
MQYAYTVIIEKSENNYGAWAPDLPGCVTTGPSKRRWRICGSHRVSPGRNARGRRSDSGADLACGNSRYRGGLSEIPTQRSRKGRESCCST